MPLYILIFICWFLFAVLDTYCDKLEVIDKKMRYIVPILVKTSFVRYVKKLALIGAITYTILAAFIYLLDLCAAQMNAGIAGFILNVLVLLKSLYTSFTEVWEWISIILLIGFLLTVVYRIITSNMKIVFKRVMEAYKTDQSDELPASGEAKRLFEEIKELKNDLHELELKATDVPEELKELQDERNLRQKKIVEKYELIERERFFERMAEQIDQKAPAYFGNRLLNMVLVFLTSAGMHVTVKKTDKVKSVIAGVFLCLSLLTVQLVQVGPLTRGPAYTLNNIIATTKIKNFKGPIPVSPVVPQAMPIVSQEVKSLIQEVRLRMIYETLRQLSPDVQYFKTPTKTSQFAMPDKSNGNEELTGKAKAPAPDLSMKTKDVTSGEVFPPDNALQITTQEKYLTSYEAGVEQELENRFAKATSGEKENLLNRWKSYLRSFREPVSLNDVINMAYENLYDGVLNEPAKELLKTVIGDEKVFSKVITDASSKSFKELFDKYMEQKIKASLQALVIEKKDLNRALAVVRKIKPPPVLTNDLNNIKEQVKSTVQKSGHNNEKAWLSDVQIRLRLETYFKSLFKENVEQANQMRTALTESTQLLPNPKLSSPLTEAEAAAARNDARIGEAEILSMERGFSKSIPGELPAGVPKVSWAALAVLALSAFFLYSQENQHDPRLAAEITVPADLKEMSSHQFKFVFVKDAYGYGILFLSDSRYYFTVQLSNNDIKLGNSTNASYVLEKMKESGIAIKLDLNFSIFQQLCKATDNIQRLKMLKKLGVQVGKQEKDDLEYEDWEFIDRAIWFLYASPLKNRRANANQLRVFIEETYYHDYDEDAARSYDSLLIPIFVAKDKCDDPLSSVDQKDFSNLLATYDFFLNHATCRFN